LNADRNQLRRQARSQLLSAAGFEVVEAGDGQEVLARVMHTRQR
jgi:CheY-like chemotaxis protein